ncbi:MAG: hypothetical protein VKK42_16885 [Lyngbya sp.]|nr:hypothetical protein [Lyngbya sp.]
METNNSLFQQTSELTAKEAENATTQELNDSELDAIAGGIKTIIAEGPAPRFRLPIPMSFINYLNSL